jgi:acyl carrier protein
VADEAAVRRLIAAMDPPLRGIVHAAGLPGRRSLAELDAAALGEMFAAKVAGTWALHRLTHDVPLDFFVACSSMVSLWGAKEQGHYVAANHFLDAFAHYRRARGLPALTINWGPLSGGGMLPDADIPELGRIGVAATPMRQIGGTLDRLLGSAAVQAAAARIDWKLFRDVYQARGPCRMFDLVADRPAHRATPATPPEPASIHDRLHQAPAGDRRDLLVVHLQATLAQVLALESGQAVDRQQSLFEMGMDSLTAMELRARLEASLVTTLPATLAFDYGTVDALAEFLLRDREEPTAPPSRVPLPETCPADDDARKRVARMSEGEVAELLAARLPPPVAP